MKEKLEELIYRIVYLEKCKIIEEIAGQTKKQIDIEWKIINIIKRIKKDKCRKILEMLKKKHQHALTQYEALSSKGAKCDNRKLNNAFILEYALRDAIEAFEERLTTSDSMEK